MASAGPDRPVGGLDSETCPRQMDWESVRKTGRLECRGTGDGKQRQETERVVISQTKQSCLVPCREKDAVETPPHPPHPAARSKQEAAQAPPPVGRLRAISAWCTCNPEAQGPSGVLHASRTAQPWGEGPQT